MSEPMHHDDNTLYKVLYALQRAGLSTTEATEVITDMQNQGIYFRENARVDETT